MDEARGGLQLLRALSGALLPSSSSTAVLHSRPRVAVSLCAVLVALTALGGDPPAPASRAPLAADVRAGAAPVRAGTAGTAAADAAAVVARFGRQALPVAALLGTHLGPTQVDPVAASVTTLQATYGSGTGPTSSGVGRAAAPMPGTTGGGATLHVPAVLAAAYGAAARSARVTCHLPVTLLAAIGEVESGSLRGRSLTPGHVVVPAVLGPRLDGTRTAAVHDSDHGALDGDPAWDRAVGPMQFLPGTWRRWRRDGDTDGTRDPQDVEDAAASAAAYLCASGRDLARPADLRAAVLSYNHSRTYLAAVLRLMARAVVPTAAVQPLATAPGPPTPATTPRPRPTVTLTATVTRSVTSTVTATVTTTVTTSVTATVTTSVTATVTATVTAPSTATPSGTSTTSTTAGVTTSVTGTPLPTP